MKKLFVILPGIWLLSTWFYLFPAPAIADEEFRASVKTFWDARLRSDFKVLYDYLPIEDRERIGMEDYLKASQNKTKLNFSNFSLSESETAGDLGWVRVVYDAAPGDMPDYPARHIDRWQVWEKQEGRWRPIPSDRESEVPSLPPRMRPADEEKLLAKRVDEFRSAMENGDWAMVYAYCDPQFRQSVSSEEFLGKNALFVYLSHAIEWVEVVGEKGRAKVMALMRRNDPHLSKAAPVTESSIEQWVKDGGQWYYLVAQRND